MNLFNKLVEQLEKLAKDAREISQVEKEHRAKGIPGKAEWQGYDADGNATVKKNDETIIVTTSTNLSIPKGTTVYIDETRTVDYKKLPPRETKREFKRPTEEIKKRPKKRRKPILPGPEVISSVRGATWLVYHEYLKRLPIKSVFNTETNPEIDNWSLFSDIAYMASLGGGALVGPIYYTLLEYHLENFTINFDDLVPPADHDDLPPSEAGISGDDYTYLYVMQASLDMYQGPGPLAQGILPGDGLFYGINSALTNTLSFLQGQGYLVFDEKYVIRPLTLSSSDALDLLLFMFGPWKAMASLVRVVAVYPPKRFQINVNAWETPDFDLAPYSEGFTTEELEQWEGRLPSLAHTQFTIPDDIAEWSSLVGGGEIGTGNTTTAGTDVYPYEVIPLHEFYTFNGENPAYDKTKFASYSENSLFLNYVVKSYTAWGDLDDSFRINYYLLTLRFDNITQDEQNFINTSYKFNIITFNTPPELKALGDIIQEDPNFPLQEGERNVARRRISYVIRGVNSQASNPATLNISAIRGDIEKTGYLLVDDPDNIGYLNYEDNLPVSYDPERAPFFVIEEPPAGFVYNNRTGYFIFDQNISAYANISLGQTFILNIEYQVSQSLAEGADTATGILTIEIIGADNALINPRPPQQDDVALDAVALSDYKDAVTVTSQEWDPDPYIEASNPGIQVFDEVVVNIPLPELDDDGNALGTFGRVSSFKLQEVSPPTIQHRLASGFTYENPSFVSANDFNFSVETDEASTGTGGAENFVTTFRPNPFDYSFLQEGEEIIVSYTMTGLVNNAPFFGNFEDLSAAQLEKAISDLIHFAYDEDWRSNIYNPRDESNEYNNVFNFPEGSSITREATLPDFNINLVDNSVSFNWIHEFPLNAINTQTPNWYLREMDQQSVYYMDDLSIVFETDVAGQERLVFYETTEEGEQVEVPYESLEARAIQRGDRFVVSDKWSNYLLPEDHDRNDATGTKWRWDYDYSETSKGYMIFGYRVI